MEAERASPRPSDALTPNPLSHLTLPNPPALVGLIAWHAIAVRGCGPYGYRALGDHQCWATACYDKTSWTPKRRP